MAISFKILGWAVKGLRCPDHEISFLKNDNEVQKITLIQMPNGTGKTTTLMLLRAALAGPDVWKDEAFDKPQQFRKNKDTHRGEFDLRLLYGENRRLTINMEFDFSDSGRVIYKTTDRGMEDGFNPPTGLINVLKPDFITLLMFDGELASNLLDANHTNAQKAIEEIYQLHFLQRMGDRITEYWDRLANNVGSSGKQHEFTRRKNKVRALEERIKVVGERKSEDEKTLATLIKEINILQEKYQKEINKNKEVELAREAAKAELKSAKQTVLEISKQVADLMRNPVSLHGDFAQNILSLRDSLDKVKLPGIAAREFFEEIAEEANCICERAIDEQIRITILSRAEKYLGSEEVAVLNAMKTDIKERVDEDVKENTSGLLLQIGRLRESQNDEDVARQKIDSIEIAAAAEDPELKRINIQITNLISKKGGVERDLERYSDKTDESETGWNLDNLNKKLKLAEIEFAAATGTISQKEKRDILNRILNKAFENSRQALNRQICEDVNTKIKILMPNNNIRVASIDKCLRLDEKEGGSVGETLTVGYAFLSSLLSNKTHNLPSVVDSPSGPIDLAIRPEIAKIIPGLGDQFIAFTISSEREGFVKPLLKASDSNVFFITLFRKDSDRIEHETKANYTYEESSDGMWVEGQTYFEHFHTDKQE
jgi:DNA sulfur modification protein DndD